MIYKLFDSLKRIAHFYEDKKFLKAAIAKFAGDKDVSHVFFSIGPIGFYAEGDVRLVSLPTKLVNTFIPFAHWYFDALVIHGFFHSFFGIKYLSLSPKIKVFAILWGFDLYALKGKREAYFQPQTLAAFRNSATPGGRFQKPDFELFLQTRVDFVSTVVPNEFEILKSDFPTARFKFVWFSYFDLQNDVLKNASAGSFEIGGDDLLLGNNASYWNNHLDAIEWVKSFSFGFGRVVCPLSYSGTESYKSLVIERLRGEFGDRALAISEFMAYAEYTKVLLGCRYVFFNSTRQIGLGNLLFALYIGCSVILHASNPLYSFFISIGVKVYSVDEALVLSELPIDVAENRKCLEGQFGASVVKERASRMVRDLVYG